jgi:hypothetical protein
MNWILSIVFFWSLCLLLLWLWKSSLFKRTWQEPYFAETPVLIESDDWGPGGDYHATRLKNLLAMFNQHRDSVNRPAILTADIVLSLPDIQNIAATNNGSYHRKTLENFPEIYKAMQAGIKEGVLVPQLHGLEHLNGKAFARLSQLNDPRIQQTKTTNEWRDWETLDPPLQGHYVDGSSLPTTPISETEATEIIDEASRTFEQLFGCPSLSTVAPCYLWNDTIEQQWSKNRISVIQTAGYRCSGRNETGKYFQDKPLLRVGDKNKFNQIYLVRNIMYEPVDGKNTTASAFQEALIAHRQALPLTISTHRYNYTRSEEAFDSSLQGLNELLQKITTTLPASRFLSSAELGQFLHHPKQPIHNDFNHSQWPGLSYLQGPRKLGAFLYRLHYRHPKLALISKISGFIIPCWLFCKLTQKK